MESQTDDIKMESPPNSLLVDNAPPANNMTRTSRKRKASTELSTNPHTVKARAREAAMQGVELEIEKAKRADQAAITYALNKLKKTPAWQAGSEAEQAEMKKSSAEAIVHKRKVDEKHWSIVARNFGYGEEGGLYAQFDDENPAWEDIDDDDDDEFAVEARWRQDDLANSEVVKTELDKAEAYQCGKGVLLHTRTKFRNIEFQTWQNKWRKARKQLIKKNIKLNLHGMNVLEIQCPYIDRSTATYYDVTPPHVFFKTAEKAIWKNMMIWMNEGEEDSDWIDLPGPAEWWPDTYNEEKHGFKVPLADNGHQEAFGIMLADIEPANYSLIFPSDNELRVMEDTPEARFIERSFL